MFILFQSITLTPDTWGDCPHRLVAHHEEDYGEVPWMPMGEDFDERSYEFGTWSRLEHVGVWRFHTEVH